MMAGVDMVARALSRRGAGAHRSDRRAGADHVPRHCRSDRAHQGRQAARARGDHRDALGGAARTFRPWANSCRATRRAHGMASARPRTRLPRSSRSSTRRSTPASPIRRSRRGLPISAATLLAGLARRLRQAHRRRNREMGQGDRSLPASKRIDPPVVDDCFGPTDTRRTAMKLPRRTFLHLAAGAAALPAAPRIAWAQAYPARPVRLIVGFAPGGATDIIARLMGQWLSERLGQQFVIENRTGAASNIATEAVVRAPADGYTLLTGHCGECDQRHALRQAQFQFHPRHRAGRGHHPLSPCHAGQSVVSGEDRPRVHRLCQGQSRQDQLWHRAASARRSMSPANYSK